MSQEQDAQIETAQRYIGARSGMRHALGLDEHAELEVRRLAQGEHNANFLLTCPEKNAGPWVLRINYVSQLGLKRQVSYEAAGLEALVSSGRVPKVLWCDDSQSIIGHGVLVIEYVEGRHLDFERAGDVDEAARILADVHSVRPDSSCTLQRPHDGLREQFDNCRRFYDNYAASPFYSDAVDAYVSEFFRLTEKALDSASKALDCNHVINTEAVPSHFLICDDGRPGHMVDWEKPLIAEVAQDIAYFLSPTTTIWDTEYLFDMKGREAFIDAYWKAVDGRFDRADFDERLEAYTRSNCLLGVTWSCNAWVEYHDPDRPLKNAKTFEKLKIYLDEAYLEHCMQMCFR